MTFLQALLLLSAEPESAPTLLPAPDMTEATLNAQIVANMLTLEGVEGVKHRIVDDEDVILFEMFVKERQPDQRYYEACRIIGRLQAMDARIDIMQVINDREKYASGDPKTYSLGRFNCSTWTFWEW